MVFLIKVFVSYAITVIIRSTLWQSQIVHNSGVGNNMYIIKGVIDKKVVKMIGFAAGFRMFISITTEKQ